MAISRLSVRVVRRSNSARLTASNVVAAAAYNSREALYDERLRETHNYAHRSADLVASEVLLPPLAPYRWFDREVLWNEVEWGERRSDARLAHAIVLTLPRELDATAGAELARDFLGRTVVRNGLIADMAVHTKTATDGGPQPHAHALLTMRRIVDKAFGRKDFAWVGSDVIRDWREQWAEMANRRLAEHGISARLHHRPIRSAVRTAARVTKQVAEVATLARAAAIIGAAVVTHAAREVVRRVVPARHERKQQDMPTNRFVPRTPIEEMKDELRQPLQAAAVGVATGVWTYGQAVDALVGDHLLSAIERHPELNSRFEELEEKIGNALTRSVTRVERQIRDGAAILRAREEHRGVAMAMTDDRVRRVVPASAAPRHEAQEPSRRAQQESQRSHVAVME